LASLSMFTYPSGLALDSAGNVIVPSGGPVQSSRLRSVDAPSSRLQKRQVDCAPPVESTQLKRPLDGRRLDSVDLTVITST